jgi:hypothetical protein
VGQLEAQDHQGGQDSVGEDQLVVGPALAARWRGWPRRWCRAPWWAAVHGSVSSAISSPRCCRDSPVKPGWERAARAHVGVDTHTRSPVRSVSRPPGDPGHDHPRPHVAELRGAIVHSGCCNRTLTPDGSSTNGERRSYWAVPDVYHAFSPLLFADRLDRPVLIVHGTDDTNPPTQPEQAVDLYRAIVATGGHARLVLLPHEGQRSWSKSRTRPSSASTHDGCGVAAGAAPPRYRLSRYPVPAASLTPIGSAWSGRATGRGGARPRPCGG